MIPDDLLFQVPLTISFLLRDIFLIGVVCVFGGIIFSVHRKKRRSEAMTSSEAPSLPSLDDPYFEMNFAHFIRTSLIPRFPSMSPETLTARELSCLDADSPEIIQILHLLEKSEYRSHPLDRETRKDLLWKYQNASSRGG